MSEHADVTYNLGRQRPTRRSPVNEYVELEGDYRGRAGVGPAGELRGSCQHADPLLVGNNEKAEAIEAHASQVADGGYFIRRFAHQDEVFWVERLGEAEGMPDSLHGRRRRVLEIAGVRRTEQRRAWHRTGRQRPEREP